MLLPVCVARLPYRPPYCGQTRPQAEPRKSRERRGVFQSLLHGSSGIPLFPPGMPSQNDSKRISRPAIAAVTVFFRCAQVKKEVATFSTAFAQICRDVTLSYLPQCVIYSQDGFCLLQSYVTTKPSEEFPYAQVPTQNKQRTHTTTR